ncbi:hypothetical protein OF83DRAFT_1166480 [Amylostereum chailletii]|nr:hypothetical protein OF83DRAFT_1166480 [Amylostereum chailletii]
MKFSVALASALYILPVLTGMASAASVAPRKGGFPGGAQGKGAQAGQAAKGANNNQNGAAANNNNNNKGSSTTAAAAASTNGATATTGGDPQSATTLDPKVIATGFALDGQQVPAANQVASLTSKNNFINFCLTAPNLPITNGQQVKTGSCNPAPMGMIAATTKMPSSKFVNPPNMGNIAANTAFTITMAIKNIKTGNFVNAQSNYYSAPQQTDGSGTIIGHSHVVIEALDSLSQTTPTDPNKFAFFKGVNTAADGQGNVNVDVTDGLPAGVYRLASINAAANHQPVLVAVAQHGTLDDMVYFTVGGNGAATGKGGNNAGAAASGAAATATSAAASASSAAAKGGQKGGNNAQGAGKQAGAGAAAGGRGGAKGAKGGRRNISRL